MDLKLINNNSLQLRNFVFVDYIESSGIPEINLGINCSYTNLIKVECVLDVIEGNSGNYIYGCFSDTNILNYVYGLRLTSDSLDSFQILSNSGNRLYYTDVSFSGKTEIIQTPTYAKVNETNYTYTYRDKQSAYTNIPFVLLGKRNMGINVPSKVRIYSFKLYIDNELVRNLVPVVSYEQGHLEESCLYDTINNRFYYSSSTGSFTPSTNLNIFNKITTAFIKGCPNVSGINLLRNSLNLTRVRCDIGNVTGHFSEIYKYSNLSGFNDNYEKQNKARIVGTFNIDDYYLDLEVTAIRNRLDGTTVNTPQEDIYNINYLLENDLLAIQTLDSTKPNYNPAAAIILNSKSSTVNKGHVIPPIIPGGGRYFLTKTDAATITTSDIINVFSNTATVVDTEAIVSNDNTATYDFVTFNEFRYFTSVTTLDNAKIGGCTKLEEVTVPEGVRSNEYWRYAFNDCTSLQTITFTNAVPDGSVTSYVYRNCSSLNKLVFPSLDLLLKQVYAGGSRQEYGNTPFVTSGSGRYFINDEELVDLVIPDSVTSITNACFLNVKNLKTISFNNVQTISDYAFLGSGLTSVTTGNSITSLGTCAFRDCSNLASDFILPNVTSFGNEALRNCSKLKNVDIRKATVNNTKILNCGDGSHTLRVKAFSREASNISPLRFKHVLCYGSYSATDAYYIIVGNYTETLRFAGSYSCNSNYIGVSSNTSYGKVIFIELMGTFTGSGGFARINIFNRVSGDIIHLGYNGIALAPEKIQASYSYITNIYVGDGSSRTNDESVLALYLADSSWATYSSKLSTWYDYNGIYKWYYVTDNLTNCTNTNPDEWPHITRGESYQTTIVPDEGMTFNSVTVKMLDTDITSNTYDTMVDITSDVYDPTIGEINISAVTGNVIITASAS